MLLFKCGRSLQGKSFHSVEGKELLNLLLQLLQETPLSGYHVAKSFQILRITPFYSDINAKFASILAEKLEGVSSISSIQLGMCLYALSYNYAVEEPALRSLLAAIHSHLSMMLPSSPENIFLQQSICNSLYGLQNMNASTPEIRAILSFLATKTEENEEEFTSKTLGMCFTGIQRMSSDVPEVLALTAALTKKLRLAKDILDVQSLGAILSSLQNFSCRDPTVQSLLRVVTLKMQKCPEKFTLKTLTMAGRGMQWLESGLKDVQAFLRAFTPKLDAFDQQLDLECTLSLLRGLWGLSSVDGAVRQYITVLAKKLRASPDLHIPLSRLSDLVGLQNMSSDRDEVLQLLAAIISKIKTSSDAGKEEGGVFVTPIPVRQIAMCMYGLKSMSSDSRQVNLLVASLLPASYRESLLQGESSEYPALDVNGMDSKMFGMWLHGMQHMHSARLEVRAMMRCFTAALHASKETQIDTRALYGLQRMRDSIEAKELLDVIAERLKSEARSNSYFCSDMGLALYGLRGVGASGDKWKSLLTLWIKRMKEIPSQPYKARYLSHLSNCYQSAVLVSFESTALWESILHYQLDADFDEAVRNVKARWEEQKLQAPLSPALGVEQEYGRAVELLIQRPDAVVETNASIHGFEADRVIRFTDNCQEIVVNVEIDGIHHNEVVKKKLFCRLRDRYLKTLGVKVFRIDITKHSSNRGESIQTFVKRMIQNELARSRSIDEQKVSTKLKKWRGAREKSSDKHGAS